MMLCMRCMTVVEWYVCVRVCVRMSLSLSLSLSLSRCLSLAVSLSLSLSLSLCLSVSVCLSLSVSVCLSLSVCLCDNSCVLQTAPAPVSLQHPVEQWGRLQEALLLNIPRKSSVCSQLVSGSSFNSHILCVADWSVARVLTPLSCV